MKCLDMLFSDHGQDSHHLHGMCRAEVVDEGPTGKIALPTNSLEFFGHHILFIPSHVCGSKLGHVCHVKKVFNSAVVKMFRTDSQGPGVGLGRGLARSLGGSSRVEPRPIASLGWLKMFSNSIQDSAPDSPW